MLILFAALVFVAVTVLLATNAATAGRARRQQSLAEIGAYGFVAAEPRAPSPQRPLRSILDDLATTLGAVSEKYLNRADEAELRRQLYAAGLYAVTPRRFLGYRLIVTIALAAFWIWISAIGGANVIFTIVGVLVSAGLGWIGPLFVVKRRARARFDAIDYEMPELVDLLVTAVEGGVGFTASLQLAARHFEGPLGEELRLALREQGMGLTINEALMNLLARTDTAAVRSFVQAVTQGETLGVSIGKILRDLANEMRRRRRSAAEERAHKAGTKILFPLVLLIFPSLFVVTLGPVLISIAKGLGG